MSSNEAGGMKRAIARLHFAHDNPAEVTAYCGEQPIGPLLPCPSRMPLVVFIGRAILCLAAAFLMVTAIVIFATRSPPPAERAPPEAPQPLPAVEDDVPVIRWPLRDEVPEPPPWNGVDRLPRNYPRYGSDPHPAEQPPAFSCFRCHGAGKRTEATLPRFVPLVPAEKPKRRTMPKNHTSPITGTWT